MVNNRLSEILKEKKITKKEFAGRMGTSPQYITGICTGKLSASINQYKKFAEALGVPVSDMFLTKQETSVFYCPHCGKPIRVIKIEEEGADD